MCQKVRDSSTMGSSRNLSLIRKYGRVRRGTPRRPLSPNLEAPPTCSIQHHRPPVPLFTHSLHHFSLLRYSERDTKRNYRCSRTRPPSLKRSTNPSEPGFGGIPREKFGINSCVRTFSLPWRCLRRTDAVSVRFRFALHAEEAKKIFRKTLECSVFLPTMDLKTHYTLNGVSEKRFSEKPPKRQVPAQTPGRFTPSIVFHRNSTSFIDEKWENRLYLRH